MITAMSAHHANGQPSASDLPEGGFATEDLPAVYRSNYDWVVQTVLGEVELSGDVDRFVERLWEELAKVMGWEMPPWPDDIPLPWFVPSRARHYTDLRAVQTPHQPSCSSAPLDSSRWERE